MGLDQPGTPGAQYVDTVQFRASGASTLFAVFDYLRLTTKFDVPEVRTRTHACPLATGTTVESHTLIGDPIVFLANAHNNYSNSFLPDILYHSTPYFFMIREWTVA